MHTDMKTNDAYGVRKNASAVDNNIYELVETNPESEKHCSTGPAKIEAEMEKKDNCFKIFITIIAVTALLLVLMFLSFFLVHYISNQPLETQQNTNIESLQSQLNSSNEQIQLHASELKEAQILIQNHRVQLNSSIKLLQRQATDLDEAHHFIQNLRLQLNSSNEQLQLQAFELEDAQHFSKSLQLQLNKTNQFLQKNLQILVEERQNDEFLIQNRIQEIKQELNNTVNLIEQIVLPTHSCRDLPQGSPSGYYYIKTSNGYIQVYCDTSLRNCTCNVTTGWLRVVELDMTDPTQQCPDGFKLIRRTEPPLRTCGRPDGHRDGCVSTKFPVHGVEYSRVCGRIVGYQFGSPSAFDTGESSIDRDYMAGISFTHGLPREHIWSFVNAQNENTTSEVCPCIRNSRISVPLFVGEDYFCDSAVRGSDRTEGIYHPDDPLWDGQGCGSTSTCCEFNNPPWFCKQLPQPTTDDIELRLCENTDSIYDDSPFELIQLYIN